VFLGLGANIGNRQANLRLATRWLARACTVVAVSSLYRSEAVVLEGSAPGPDYLNAVCEVMTDLPPADLLRFVQSLEREIGRRPAERWAARVIDVDILLYGEYVIETGDLIVPHPRLTERNFVLVPLAELAAEAMHPLLGRAIGELAEDIDFGGLEHLKGPEWVVSIVDSDDHDEEDE
jgi:2-amino-4-hydroxy-6-hydroxymethyldihydropteridine diphosphokinase